MEPTPSSSYISGRSGVSETDLRENICRVLDDLIEKLERAVDDFLYCVDRMESIPELPEDAEEQNTDYHVQDSQGFVKVFIHGAYYKLGNKNARAGIGIYWGEGSPLNVSQSVSGDQVAENTSTIRAAITAIQQALHVGVEKLAIYTHSMFLTSTLCEMEDWKKQGSKMPYYELVKNDKDFRELVSFQGKLNIDWYYLKGNERQYASKMAIQLANAGAAMKKEKVN